MSEFAAVSEQEWRGLVERELGGEAPATLGSETLEGLRMGPLYTAAAGEEAGTPSVEFRSVADRLESPWSSSARFDDPDLEVVRGQVRDDCRGGTEGIWLKFDRRARLGLTLDSAAGSRAAGRDGVLLLDAADLAELLGGAGDGAKQVWLDAGGNGLAAGALLTAALDLVSLDVAATRVRFGIDPLAALAADGEIPGEAAGLVREALWLSRRIPAFAPGSSLLTVSSLPYVDAGANAVQQLAFMTATTVQYLRWLESAGMAPERVLAQLDVVLGMDRDFLRGVAMLRAARILQAKVAAACGVSAVSPRLHAVAGGRTLTRRMSWTNLLRVTTQTAAAIVGGADVITTAPFDLPLGRSDSLARRIARNTQTILRDESGLGRTIDPARGSYAVESLSDDLARRAWDEFREIERGGGMHQGLLDGRIQDRVEASARRRAARLLEQRDVLVGVSRFEHEAGDAPERPPVDRPAVVRAAHDRLTQHMAGRGDPLVEAVRGAADRAAASADGARPVADVFDAAVEAARAGATLAELSAALRPGGRRERARRLRPRSDEELWDLGEEVRE